MAKLCLAADKIVPGDYVFIEDGLVRHPRKFEHVDEDLITSDMLNRLHAHRRGEIVACEDCGLVHA